MATSLLGLILALLLPISAAAGPLSLRLEQWPSWQLPAPLPRPSPGDDLIYPAWFEGDWQLSSSDGISAEVHFARRADGAQHRLQVERRVRAGGEAVRVALATSPAAYTLKAATATKVTAPTGTRSIQYAKMEVLVFDPPGVHKFRFRRIV